MKTILQSFIKLHSVILFMLFSMPSFSQTASIRGVVTDSVSQKPIRFVNVILKRDDNTDVDNTISDEEGNFKFTGLDKGQYYLIAAYIGYKNDTIKFDKRKDTTKAISFLIKLAPKSLSLSEVTVTSNKTLVQSMNCISSVDMQLRPVNSAQDLMRLVPGLFLAQHQGGGKAEQIFLRGFDADHGTDFAVFWDGIPVNMPSHAHGQGYADSHFMIPETIDQLEVSKGTYATRFGDFATAGAAEFTTKNHVDNMVKMETGDYGMYRLMGMFNLIGKDQHFLSKYNESAYISAENMYNAADYFSNPQDYKRLSVFGKYYGQLSERTKLTVEGSYFRATWNGSGQVPERAISEGVISRFGAIDPSEGGQTDRTNANVILKTFLSNGAVIKNQFYYSYYQLNLFTDFTFFLVDTVHGDGINQRDKGRNVFGYNGSYEINKDLGGHNLKTVFGLTTKGDAGEISLRHQEDRVVLDTVSMGNLYEQSHSAYVDETYQLSDKFFINGGVRADVFYFNYHDIRPVYDTTSAGQTIGKVSPKLNLYYDLNPNVQFFIRSGYGFHSNDARAVVANPNLTTLPTALGYEIGSTFKPMKNVLVNAALWGIHLQNELTFDPDISQDIINGPTQRLGADLSVRYQLTKILFLDIDLNYSDGRYTDLPEGQNYIALAPTFTSVAGITVKQANGFSGSLRYRAIDNRPANEDNRVQALGYFLVDAVMSYRVKKYQFGITVENVLNVAWNEAQFDTLTRLKGESVAGIDQLCFTPGAPRLIKASISYFFK